MSRRPASAVSPAAARCGDWLDAAGLFGLPLFLLLFQTALVAGVTLLILGVYLWLSWPVLAGLLLLRLFLFLAEVGRHYFSAAR